MHKLYLLYLTVCCSGWSAHAIVTSYRFTRTLQVYTHPTSIQTPCKYIYICIFMILLRRLGLLKWTVPYDPSMRSQTSVFTVFLPLVAQAGRAFSRASACIGNLPFRLDLWMSPEGNDTQCAQLEKPLSRRSPMSGTAAQALKRLGYGGRVDVASEDKSFDACLDECLDRPVPCAPDRPKSATSPSPLVRRACKADQQLRRDASIGTKTSTESDGTDMNILWSTWWQMILCWASPPCHLGMMSVEHDECWDC